MTKKPKIAILIPAYNAEKYINACLSSISAQTYSDFEIYALDDGSVDNTFQILKQYARTEPRLHTFTQQNRGVTKTLNTLLDKVPNNTDYIFYIDADDLIHKKTLEYLLFYINKYNADLAECQSLRIDDKTMKAPNQTINHKQSAAVFIKDMNIFLTKKHVSAIGCPDGTNYTVGNQSNQFVLPKH